MLQFWSLMENFIVALTLLQFQATEQDALKVGLWWVVFYY